MTGGSIRVDGVASWALPDRDISATPADKLPSNSGENPARPLDARRSTSGSQASPAEREAHVRKQFEDLFVAVSADIPEAAMQPVIEELVNRVLESMDLAIGDSRGPESMISGRDKSRQLRQPTARDERTQHAV
jgi:hypothetical protein